jgi:RNA polymerase sigma-70 factor, ECF subfamily
MTPAPLSLYLEIGRLRVANNRNLLQQARRGHRDAFAQMVTPFVPSVYRRARGLTGNTADAEDVSQETLLKAWSRLEQFTGNQAGSDDFRAWISRIASNSSIDLLRQRRDGKMVSLDEPKGLTDETLGSGIPAKQHDPEEQCARREMSRLLANAILQLPRDLRQACLLRDVLHYTTEEVADRLGTTTVAVRLRLFRAHRRLREKLQQTMRPAPAALSRNARGNGFPGLDTAASYASGD